MAQNIDFAEAAKKGRGLIGEFRAFILRGNVMDMAVGVIIGGAFQAIVNSLVSDILMPVISKITGGIDISNLFLPLDGKEYATLAEAEQAGAATLNYGTFLTAVINFFLMALVIFLFVKAMNRMHERIALQLHGPEEKKAPATKTCPYCLSEIPSGASRCPHCTSRLDHREESADPTE